jgi:DNA-binding NtrC family response regulator
MTPPTVDPVPQPIPILLLDDMDLVRDSLQEYLSDSGFSVRGAGDSAEAFTMLEAEPAAVVVVDLRLPGMGGEAFIREAAHRWPATRFVIFTGNADYRPTEDLLALPQMVPEPLMKPLLDLNILVRLLKDLSGRGAPTGDSRGVPTPPPGDLSTAPR